MAEAIKWIIFALQLIPIIVDTARQLQVILPAGSGAVKLETIKAAANAALQSDPQIAKAVQVDRALALVTSVTSAVVDVLKPTGAIGPISVSVPIAVTIQK